MEERVGDRGQSQFGDLLRDDEGLFPGQEPPDRPDDAASEEELRSEVTRALETLGVRERTILTLRFGLDTGSAKSLAEVGQQVGLSGERVRQIQAFALRKMRHPSRSKLLKDFLE